MKIYSYNVNGIRAAAKKGLWDWWASTDGDILCIQETKAHPEQVDLSHLTDAGYHCYWHSAEKKGYSGVLTISKQEAREVRTGVGKPLYDMEGRKVLTVFDDFALLNGYFPSGSSSEERHAFKMQYLHDFRPWVENLLQEFPNLIVVGDYNVVHLDLDIHNPTRKDNPSGYRPEERVWMDEYFNELFDDAYRQIHPEREGAYSWWSYRAGSRGKNKGWRIDYIALSKDMSSRVKGSEHDTQAVHSDHCPVWCELDF